MEFVGRDVQTMAYIESDAEFDRAKMRGFWEKMLGRLINRSPCPIPFAQAIATFDSEQTINLGLRDVSLKDIVGSVGRHQDFTRTFMPCYSNRSARERWRAIYTRAVTGAGFPPVELYKIGDEYFVRDGHHRVSVARYLGWDTIQACVTEVLAPVACCAGSYTDKGVELCCAV